MFSYVVEVFNAYLHWLGSFVFIASVTGVNGFILLVMVYPWFGVSWMVKFFSSASLSTLMIGEFASLGLVSTHNSLLLPSLMSLQVCPKLLHRYSEQGFPSLPHVSHVLPPVGATHGLQVNDTVSSLVSANNTSSKL